MSEKERVKKLEKDVKRLENLILNHIGDGADAHALSEEGLAGFLSADEKFLINNSSGRRAPVSGLDFNTIDPGLYEGNLMKNGPISETNNGFLEFDVSESKDGRRKIDVVKSSNGQAWQKIVHTDGLVAQDWIRILKAYGIMAEATANPNLTAAQKDAINISYRLIQIPNFFDIVNLTISLEPGAIPKGSVSPLIITNKIPSEIHPGRVLRDIYPDLTTPSDQKFWVACGLTSANSQEFRVNFDSSLDYSTKAYKIDRLFIKEASINNG